MAICKFNVDNFEYNIESNLAAMGLPFPKTVFGSASTVSGALGAISTALSTKASDVPLSVLSVGRTNTQLLGIGAAFWAGAVIGSAFMASKRATSCSSSELKEAFQAIGLPSWAADDALRSPNGHHLLRTN